MPARPRCIVYPVLERPEITVRHDDGLWYPGRLHAWRQVPGGWNAVVTYLVGVGAQYYRDLASDRVRKGRDGAGAAPAG